MIVQESLLVDPGGIDQNGRRPEVFADAGHKAIHRGPVGHIQRRDMQAQAKAARHFGLNLRLPGAAGTDGDAVAARKQGLRASKADAGGAPGDDGNAESGAISGHG